ncbi:MAG: ferric-dicitrate binding protein FerR (iron transport regulator) [Verrucomicrobiales bacterium]|jgi:ferric-dicitrate binding protein FerR (iron transport regulator)
MTEDELDLLHAYLNGNLTPEELEALNQLLRRDAEAQETLRTLATVDAKWQQLLARSPESQAEAATEFDSHPSGRDSRKRSKMSRTWMAIAAALIAMLTLIFWPRHPTDQTFATLEQGRAALWESGDLSTENGSRLGKGTLRLAEGLATLRFDSGAEVILEAPAELILVDAMNCELNSGTVVSDIPKSAQGFRIKTPSADVVDYGTRFAVSVYEGTGETHTQVIEGRVQVEYARSDEVIELKTGQQNTVVGESFGEATDGADQEHRTIPVIPIDHGPGWILLETAKDAYTGRVAGHESDVLLYLKTGGPRRTAYLGFDLGDIDREDIAEAELLLFFAPTGWGLASHVPDATFSIYGLVGEIPLWKESILHGQFPGQPAVERLGSFTIPQGVQRGSFRVHSDALVAFLRGHAASEITLKVVRDTEESEGGGLVHGFASRRHPILPAPTLAIRENQEVAPD